MYIVYLDESGDPGLVNSPSQHYILAGFSVHYADWPIVDRRLSEFRKWAEEVYGLQARQEIHSAEFLGSAQIHCGLRRDQRLLIVRRLIGILAGSSELKFFGWTTEKDNGDPLNLVGERCMLDLATWIGKGEMGSGRLGLIIHDQMHKRPSSWKQSLDACFIDQPLARSSSGSAQLQVADLVAYLLKQSRCPNRYLKEQGAHQLIKRLNDQSMGWYCI